MASGTTEALDPQRDHCTHGTLSDKYRSTPRCGPCKRQAPWKVLETGPAYVAADTEDPDQVNHRHGWEPGGCWGPQTHCPNPQLPRCLEDASKSLRGGTPALHPATCVVRVRGRGPETCRRLQHLASGRAAAPADHLPSYRAVVSHEVCGHRRKMDGQRRSLAGHLLCSVDTARWERLGPVLTVWQEGLGVDRSAQHGCDGAVTPAIVTGRGKRARTLY